MALLLLLLLLSTLLCLILSGIALFIWGVSADKFRSSQHRVVTPDNRYHVLVLGDIGRSPRMQYHALSIAKKSAQVELIGYLESPLLPELISSPNVTIRALEPPPQWLRSGALPFLVSGPLKVLWQIYDLSRMLGFVTKPAKWLIVQNPPSIPTLIVADTICRFRNTKLLIDWHNYGWTILAGTKGDNHPFVSISKAYECFFGRIAPTASLTVTDAMRRQLQKAPYSIKSKILPMHDRPATIFQSIRDNAAWINALGELEILKDVADPIRRGQMRLIVSSTSWTPDEDFGILLEALCQYNNAVHDGREALPPICAVITGKGPQRAMYEARIKALRQNGRFSSIVVKTVFLSFKDYAKLLAVAHLGICLHKSSSGVDLPMKVVDMFGTGCPVAAYSGYESFAELVKEGQNGCGFETSTELAGILTRLCGASGQDELSSLRKGATGEGERRWDDEWDSTVAPLLGL